MFTFPSHSNRTETKFNQMLDVLGDTHSWQKTGGDPERALKVATDGELAERYSNLEFWDHEIEKTILDEKR
jgi:hypothetical protein